MSRLLNRERTARERKHASAPDPATAASLARSEVVLNRLPTDPPRAFRPPHHPMRRRLALSLALGICLVAYARTQQLPDPWISLLEGTGPGDNLQPAVRAATLQASAAAPAEPPTPLPFADERVRLSAQLPADLAIEVRNPLAPPPAAPPENPALSDAVEALLQLEDTLAAAAELTLDESPSL